MIDIISTLFLCGISFVLGYIMGGRKTSNPNDDYNPYDPMEVYDRHLSDNDYNKRKGFD
jgi:hypothetical protein